MKIYGILHMRFIKIVLANLQKILVFSEQRSPAQLLNIGRLLREEID
jgi:hypothetical protein